MIKNPSLITFTYRFGSIADILVGKGTPILQEDISKVVKGRYIVGVSQVQGYRASGERNDEIWGDLYRSSAEHLFCAIRGEKIEIVPDDLICIVHLSGTSRDDIKKKMEEACIANRLALTPLNRMPDYRKKLNVLTPEYVEKVSDVISQTYKAGKDSDKITRIAEVSRPLIYCQSKYGLTWNEARTLEWTKNSIRRIQNNHTSNP